MPKPCLAVVIALAVGPIGTVFAAIAITFHALLIDLAEHKTGDPLVRVALANRFQQATVQRRSDW